MTPGCNFRTELLQGDVAIEYLKLHVSQVHGVCSKQEKPKNDFGYDRDTIPALDWDSFSHRFDVYKRVAGVQGDAGRHLLVCLSK